VADEKKPRPRQAVVPALAFAASTAAAVGLAITYALGGQTQLEGVLLAVALGGIGIGLVSWSRRLMPDELVIEERGRLASDPEELEALVADVTDSDDGVERRSVLVKLLGLSAVALGGAALFPIASLGPKPGRGLKTTPYAKGGLRLVEETGQLVTTDRLSLNGVLTVFPEGFEGREDAQTLLLHLEEGEVTPREGREDWTPDGYVAFSKVCTHAGCPVGLFEEREALLLCPCHQSTFDVRDAARPIFGPAARSLPQLPLDIDDTGTIFATGDFSGPVGPGFWDRDR
jgi:ubiquinol-cytochrome c reductase iron-sulfur subunit